MNQLNQAFQEALCTDPVPVGMTVHCQCGQPYKATLEEPQFMGTFAGLAIVKGCECDATGSFGNMAWQHRHIMARFFRLMAKALAADSARLIDTLPPAMGQDDWSGLKGTLKSGGRAQCIDDQGTMLQVIGEGRCGRETVMRGAFTPDKDQV